MNSKRFAVIVSRFNSEVTDGLLLGSRKFLNEQGVNESNIEVLHAPGAFEIPLLAKALAETKRYAGIVCLGAVIKGDTAHFEFISLGATMGVMQAMLETRTPISFGILTTYDDGQAISRSRDDAHNKGREAAAACWDLASQLAKLL